MLSDDRADYSRGSPVALVPLNRNIGTEVARDENALSGQPPSSAGPPLASLPDPVPTATSPPTATPLPTLTPTPIPTDEPPSEPEPPTAAPTSEPSPVPTEPPTAVPTQLPTVAPTIPPTAVPTAVPTPVPPPPTSPPPTSPPPTSPPPTSPPPTSPPPPIPVVAFSTANVATGEVNAGVTITVILSVPTTQNVTVNYATFDGTATAGSDYVAVSGILTFTPGQVSQSFIVPILDDTINEVAETVGLQLSAPVNGTLGTPNPATLTISDNDPVTVQFSSSTYSVVENAGPAVVAVTLSTTSTQTITVDYATSELLATAGLDYTDVNNVLTFAPGQTSLNFSVPIIDDDFQEPDETVQLTLSNPTNGATLGTPNPATLTIIDNVGDAMGCPTTTPAGEPDIIPFPASSPDGTFVEIGCGTAIIVDLGLTVIDTTTRDPAYDLVYYERGQPAPPMTSTFIFMDWVQIQIGPTASGPWYSVFYWGDTNNDTNSNVNWTALGGIGMEANNMTISTTLLYSSTNPIYPTGIAIDVDNPNPALQSPPPPPGIYQFVRLFNPPNLTLSDPPEVDALEVLP